VQYGQASSAQPRGHSPSLHHLEVTCGIDPAPAVPERGGGRTLAVATFWHTINGSLLAMYWRLRGFPAGEDPHATVRELRRRAEDSSPAGD